MIENFKPCSMDTFKLNPFERIGKDWMLITAGTPDKWNTMTASWGGMGVIWHKPVCTIYVRPQRFTYEFIENSDYFTLSFFGPEYKDELTLCGSKSGREIDKAEATDLTPVTLSQDSVGFAQADFILVCKKLYYQDFNPEYFLDEDISANYPNKDYHRMYIGEVFESLCRNGVSDQDSNK